MKDTKKVIIMIFAVVFFLLSLYIILYLYKGNDYKKDIENLNGVIPNGEVQNKLNNLDINSEKLEKEKKVLERKKDIGFFNEVGNNGNIELCNDIKDAETKKECIDNGYIAKSYLEKSSKYCFDIKDKDLQNRCFDNFYYDKAILSNDYKICSKIINDELKYKCNSTVIFTLVENPGYSGSKDICKILIGNDKAYCENTVNSSKDTKIIYSALESNNINNCNTIKNSKLLNTCKDTINSNVALETKSISKCNLIINSQVKKSCVESLQKYEDKDILQKAIGTNNIKECNNIDNLKTKESCEDNIKFKTAINTKNQSQCNSIINAEIKKGCNYFFEVSK